MKKTYIFDCDGVIFDSNKFKIEAFEYVLINHNIKQSDVSKFISHHKLNGGVSRYVKFKRLFTDILKSPVDNDMLKSLLSDFSKICIQKYLKADLTPGFLDKVKYLSVENNLYVASGSDEIELNYIFGERNISKYFKEILGSPMSKTECVKKIVYNLKSHDDHTVLMIGDSESDYAASLDNNIDFIFMRRFSTSQEMRENTQIIKLLWMACPKIKALMLFQT